MAGTGSGADVVARVHGAAVVDSDAAVQARRQVRRQAGRAERTRRRGLVLVAISVGGGLGSCARYLIGTALPDEPGQIPWGTFLINVSGCLALGALMVGVTKVWPPSRYIRPFWGIGFLGGFTTFSTFAVQLRDLAAGGAWGQAVVYAAGSAAAGIAGVWAGAAAARRVLRTRAGEDAR